MWATLLAVSPSLLGFLVVAMAGIAVLWLVVRAAIDFAHWFKDEIIEDFRQGRKRRKRPSGSDRAKRE
jgi:hypothetical protein